MAPTRIWDGDGPTGFRTEGCYAADLEDCDGKALTAEHYISHAVLRQIGKVVEFEGLPWALSEPRAIGVASATARVLCRRHNSALSPLDASAGRLFECLVKFHAGKATDVSSFAGEDIERWMMKVLFGLAASGNIGRHDGQLVRETPPREFLEMLFWDKELPEGRGLYFFDPGEPDHPGNMVSLIPKSYGPGHPEEGRLFGLSAILLGVGLCTALCTSLSKETGFTGTLIYRPGRFELEDEAAIDFHWNSACSETTIRVSRTPLTE